MTTIDIDISRFDYGNPQILEDLYLETPLDIKTDDDFFKLPLNEEYANNKERIERDEKLAKEKLKNIYSDESEIDELVQQLSSTPIIHASDA
jgi:hypothetical protein